MKNYIRNTVFIILLCPIWTVSLLAQLPCGNDDFEPGIRIDQRILENEWTNLNSGERGANRVFMVAIHIIRASNGTGGIERSIVLKAIDDMNKTYESAKIEFQLCDEVAYIDNDNYLEMTTAQSGEIVMKYNIKDVINIYFFPKIVNSSGIGLCGNATLPSSQTEWRRIFMANSCVANGSTLTHEMGHYFGLLHTHSKSGVEEYVDRINCQTQGDGFCDTPADPELSSLNVSNCIYFGNQKDGLGKTYKPDPSNFMSYSPKSCRNKFSPQQSAFISLIAGNENNYLLRSCDVNDLKLSTTESDKITLRDFSTLELPVLIEGINLEASYEVGFQISVTINNGFDKKIIEQGILNFNAGNNKVEKIFSIELKDEFLNTDNLKIEIDPQNYVKEFKENNNLLTYSIVHDYRKDMAGILFPNPTDDILQVYLNNPTIGEIKIRVFDNIGRLVINSYVDKKFVSDLTSIEVANLSPGVYYLLIDGEGKKQDAYPFIKK